MCNASNVVDVCMYRCMSVYRYSVCMHGYRACIILLVVAYLYSLFDCSIGLSTLLFIVYIQIASIQRLYIYIHVHIYIKYILMKFKLYSKHDIHKQ